MEYWNVYDRAGSWTGRTVPKGTPFLLEEYHPAMEAWIVNGRGELLIQRRSPDCEVLPGIWGMTTGRMSAPASPGRGTSVRAGGRLGGPGGDRPGGLHPGNRGRAGAFGGGLGDGFSPPHPPGRAHLGPLPGVQGRPPSPG